MDRLPTTDVSGWVHDQLQGEVIEKGGPELPRDSTPVVINRNVADQFKRSATEIFSIGPNHARSYELGEARSDATVNDLTIWRDQHDNPYTSFSFKGNNFTREQVIGSRTAPSGYIAFGLLESDALLRVVRASRMMREGGISTEWINRVFEPQEMIYQDEKVSQAEFKRRLLGRVAFDHGLKQTAKIAEAIEPMTFFVTGRSMEINDRPADFERDNVNSLKARLRHVFNVYNTLHQDDTNYRSLDVEKVTDVHEYFSEVLPFLIGRSIGNLHNLGLAHSFPVMGNVNALGGLVDLDSVKGAPLQLGEEAITVEERAMDLFQLTGIEPESDQFIDIYRHLVRIQVLGTDNFTRALDATVESYTAHRHAPEKQEDVNRESLYLSLASMGAMPGFLDRLQAIMPPDDVEHLYASARKQAFDTLIDRMHGTYSGYAVLRTLDSILRSYAQRHLLHMDVSDEQLTNSLTEAAGSLDIWSVLHKENDETDASVSVLLGDNRIRANIQDAIPDEQTLNIVLEQLVKYCDTGIPFDLKERGPKTLQGINDSIQEFAQSQLRETLDSLDGDYWKPVVQGIPAFDVLELKSTAHNVTVFERQSVYAYSGVSLPELINACNAASVPVILSPIGMQDFENIQVETPGVTTAFFSDSKYAGIDYVFDKEFAIRLKPVEYDPDRTEYFAWLCKRGEEGFTLLVTHRDSEEFKKAHPEVLQGKMGAD